MSDSSHSKILKALLLFLKPIARSMLAVGIGYREFSEITKAAFVSVATSDFGLRGRPTNISRVAVMTGLTRKEVRRIRDKFDAGEETLLLRSTPMAEILHRWHTDKTYLDSDSYPRVLAFDEGENSFSSLVRKYGGDIPPGAMRTELKRTGAIEELPDGSLRPVKRSVARPRVEERLADGLALVMYPAALALVRNTRSDVDSTWIHRTTATKYIRKEDQPRLMRICNERADEFSEAVDDLFGAYENLYKEDARDGSKQVVGVGVFYFEDDNPDVDVFR